MISLGDDHSMYKPSVGNPLAPHYTRAVGCSKKDLGIEHRCRKEPEMTSRTIPVRNEKKVVQQITTYFGMHVDVLVQMEHYSLILCRGRKSIVCTEDLQSVRVIERAA